LIFKFSYYALYLLRKLTNMFPNAFHPKKTVLRVPVLHQNFWSNKFCPNQITTTYDNPVGSVLTLIVFIWSRLNILSPCSICNLTDFPTFPSLCSPIGNKIEQIAVPHPLPFFQLFSFPAVSALQKIESFQKRWSTFIG
jgi:hypothetical protein